MKNLGIILIIVGALLLILCALVPFMGDMADQNWYTWGSFCLSPHFTVQQKADALFTSASALFFTSPCPPLAGAQRFSRSVSFLFPLLSSRMASPFTGVATVKQND